MWMMINDIGEARIRVPDQIRRGDLITVNAIVSHPMDTGFFRTAEGDPIPAYFIKDVVVTYGDQEVARFEWTSGISRDPVVSFTLKADREARLTMIWSDNKGASFKQSVNISFISACPYRSLPFSCSPVFWPNREPPSRHPSRSFAAWLPACTPPLGIPAAARKEDPTPASWSPVKGLWSSTRWRARSKGSSWWTPSGESHLHPSPGSSLPTITRTIISVL